MPCVTVNVDDDILHLKKLDFGVVSKSSTSLLFIFYADYSGDNVQIFKVMHAMNRVADFSVNYILIILRTSSNLDRGVENILQHAWRQSMLNMVIAENRQPLKTFERILFIVVVILAFMYSSDIYASFTTLGIDPLKTVPYFSTRFCPEMAMVHRNVCCIMTRIEAEYYKSQSHTNDGQYRLQVAKPSFWSDTGVFHFRWNLPGKTNMKKIIENFREAGILNKFYATPYMHPQNDQNDNAYEMDEQSQIHLLRQLVMLAVIGNSLAVIVCIGELLAHRFKNSVKGKVKLNLCGVFRRRMKQIQTYLLLTYRTLNVQVVLLLRAMRKYKIQLLDRRRWPKWLKSFSRTADRQAQI
ncbi:uncharacterized protein LOC114841335 [Diachasma alloeum]|uniref:uncharacterized protein LOC114841335 n=1 Tax=Diachasma alloeum TaxID=454923 RepID=UPI0010FB5F0A|nr:uncharacterized protein LOC114841335 [Diachasma alloeum]